jgi:hypothetical protein
MSVAATQADSMIDATPSFRMDYRATEIPAGYSGWRHFAITNTFVFVSVAICAWQLADVQLWEWLLVPLIALYANLAEYFGHRFVMHRPRRGFGLIYKRHVKQHHRFFTDTAMPVDSSRDFKAVLFPPILLMLFLGAFGTPVALAVGYWVSANAGWLFAITGLLYFLNYEYLHLAYHLPETHWVSRLPFMARLKRLHTRHHDQAQMAHGNFNITYPIGDWLFRTLR